MAHLASVLGCTVPGRHQTGTVPDDMQGHTLPDLLSSHGFQPCTVSTADFTPVQTSRSTCIRTWPLTAVIVRAACPFDSLLWVGVPSVVMRSGNFMTQITGSQSVRITNFLCHMAFGDLVHCSCDIFGVRFAWHHDFDQVNRFALDSDSVSTTPCSPGGPRVC